MEGSFSNYRKNRRIPLKRKLEVIEYSNIRGNNTAAASRESVKNNKKMEKKWKRKKRKNLEKKLIYIKVDLKFLIIMLKNKFMIGLHSIKNNIENRDKINKKVSKIKNLNPHLLLNPV